MFQSQGQTLIERRKLAVLLWCALLLCGCDGGPRLVGLSGAVTYREGPVEEGTIEFTPVDGTRGPLAGATIKNGEYEVPAQHGVVMGGTYKVSIISMKQTDRKIPGETGRNGEPLFEFENVIPPEYNTASKLRFTISENSELGHSDFHLPTKP